MKFVSAFVLVAAATIGMVSAQGTPDACKSCLQSALSALPLCKGLNIKMGELDPAADPSLVPCLCSSLDGAWVDGCTGAAQCGQDISSFKKSYSDNIQDAGLSCGASPTFIPGSA
ncbi:hypothetical protein B0O80DRAFT_434573 [Mortierella sp. GBAus27b]|nr:hypothetical protein BGX31_002569 [Mortierella sp. GBA43]KAI8361882.1 hypothetical protein B0O80DRAFT_434573 [Mortierella sp. GBAus27b]